MNTSQASNSLKILMKLKFAIKLLLQNDPFRLISHNSTWLTDAWKVVMNNFKTAWRLKNNMYGPYSIPFYHNPLQLFYVWYNASVLTSILLAVSREIFIIHTHNTVYHKWLLVFITIVKWLSFNGWAWPN